MLRRWLVPYGSGFCGLKGMEDGVIAALRDIATTHGLAWADVHAKFKREGRLQLETY